MRARNKVKEEEARVDDQYAAGIDTSQAKDPSTLALAPSVSIDPTLYVTCRDIFSLHLRHANGQIVMCRVELILRERRPENGTGGDLLIAELQDDGPHLLFSPIDFSMCSARPGELPGELAVMIRGTSPLGQAWQEVLLLYTDNIYVPEEWVDALGKYPVPPMLARQQSFIRAKVDPSPPLASDISSIAPSIQPINELATSVPQSQGSPKGHASTYAAAARDSGRALSPVLEGSSELDADTSVLSAPPQSLNDAMMQAGTSPTRGLQRKNAKRMSKSLDQSTDITPEEVGKMHGKTSPASEMSAASTERG